MPRRICCCRALLKRGKQQMSVNENRIGVRQLVAIAMLASAAQVNAQENALQFEVTPFAAYRLGGSFDARDGSGRAELNDSDAAGVILNMFANPNGQYELLYARQRTDAKTSGFFANDPTINMDIEQLQIGGTYLFDGERVRPFIAMALGVTHFDPELTGTGSDSFFSASFAGGVQVNARKRLGLRIEARVLTTFVDDRSNLFCSSAEGAGACQVQVDARTLSQWQALAGLVFRF